MRPRLRLLAALLAHISHDISAHITTRLRLLAALLALPRDLRVSSVSANVTTRLRLLATLLAHISHYISANFGPSKAHFEHTLL